MPGRKILTRNDLVAILSMAVLVATVMGVAW